MRTSLLTNPRVNGIARILERSPEVSRALTTGYNGSLHEIVTRTVTRHVTVSSLLIIWGAANEHTKDGVFRNADLSDIDDMVSIPGFGAAMVEVGWAEFDSENYCVTLPNFAEYNTTGDERSAGAKTGAQRQKEYRDRKKAQDHNEGDVTGDVTRNRREEKRREEKKEETLSPGKVPDEQAGNDVPPESVEKRKKRRGSEEDYKAARWMFGLVLAVNATARPPNWDVWADEVRLMREIDGRTHKEICELFQWAKHDGFWCANIQSPGKLRDKWNMLTERRARPNPPGAPKVGMTSTMMRPNEQDYSSSAAAAARTKAQWGIDGTDGNLDI
jgi:hypothetical protein